MSFFVSFEGEEEGWRKKEEKEGKKKTTRLYLHSLFPLGHCQNQPYCRFSTASRKCLQMMLVRLLAWAAEELPASAPCFCFTTDSSFSVSFFLLLFFRGVASFFFGAFC